MKTALVVSLAGLLALGLYGGAVAKQSTEVSQAKAQARITAVMQASEI